MKALGTRYHWHCLIQGRVGGSCPDPSAESFAAGRASPEGAFVRPGSLGNILDGGEIQVKYPFSGTDTS